MKNPIRTERPLRLAWPAIALATATLLAAGTTFAEQDASTPEQAERLIERLDAETLEARDRATETLQSFSGPLERIVVERIKTSDLSPEQLARLDEALYQRFADKPRAGMGVAFAANNPGGGVLLQRILNQFPVSEHLKRGDVIQRVEGASLLSMPDRSARATLRRHILSFNPGEKIEVKVLRQDQSLTLRVPLGSYEDLGDAMPVSDEDLRSAWALRRDRLGLELRPKPGIQPPTDEANWPRFESKERSDAKSRTSLAAAGDQAPLIAPDPSDARAAKRRLAANQQRRPVRLQVMVNDGDDQRVHQRDEEDDRQRRTQIKRLIKRWESQRREAMQVVQNPDVDRASRQDALQRAAQAEAALQVLRRRLEALDE